MSSLVYVAEKAAIHVCNMDDKTGALTAVGEPVDKDGAGSFVAISDNGKFLYSIAKPGAAAFSIDPSTGSLTHINTVKCDISGNAHAAVTATGSTDVLLLAAYGGGGVNIIKIRPDGGLANVEPGMSKQHKGGSNVYQPARGNEQEDAHPHSCLIHPTGKWTLVSDLGQDKIYVYAVDNVGGKLSEHAVVDTAPGAGPRHMCFHPKVKFVYGINELDCTVNVYELLPDGDILGKILQTISTLPEGYNNRDHGNAKNANGEPASGPNRPEQTNATADIHITPNGRFLYGSNRGHDSIVCYAVGKDGMLKLEGFTYCRGEHPRNFSIHPSGRWLLVANQDSDNVVVFKIERSGKLTYADSEVAIKTARCIQWGMRLQRLRKPNWSTVAEITPEKKGVNVFVKVVSIQNEGNQADTIEVVVGDATGVVTLIAIGEQLPVCKVGAILRIQNAHTKMVKGFVRLEVSKWGVVTTASDGHEDITPNIKKDISAVEYELA